MKANVIKCPHCKGRIVIVGSMYVCTACGWNFLREIAK